MNLPSSIQELANLSSIVGLLISVVGLAISIWVLVNTLRLKAQFKLLIGLPRLLVKAYRDDLSNQEKLWEVYCELQGLIEKIENIQEDRLEER
jgi:hypothetical protein